MVLVKWVCAGDWRNSEKIKLLRNEKLNFDTRKFLPNKAWNWIFSARFTIGDWFLRRCFCRHLKNSQPSRRRSHVQCSERNSTTRAPNLKGSWGTGGPRSRFPINTMQRKELVNECWINGKARPLRFENEKLENFCENETVEIEKSADKLSFSAVKRRSAESLIRYGFYLPQNCWEYSRNLST